MTKHEMAQAIVDAAVEQGATEEMISAWTLMQGDEDFVRAEYPSDDYPAEAVSADEWRSVMSEVEGLVRDLGRDMQRLAAASAEAR